MSHKSRHEEIDADLAALESKITDLYVELGRLRCRRGDRVSEPKPLVDPEVIEAMRRERVAKENAAFQNDFAEIRKREAESHMGENWSVCVVSADAEEVRRHLCVGSRVEMYSYYDELLGLTKVDQKNLPPFIAVRDGLGFGIIPTKNIVRITFAPADKTPVTEETA